MFYWLNWKLDQLENSKFENWTKLTKSDKIEKVRKDKFVEARWDARAKTKSQKKFCWLWTNEIRNLTTLTTRFSKLFNHLFLRFHPSTWICHIFKSFFRVTLNWIIILIDCDLKSKNEPKSHFQTQWNSYPWFSHSGEILIPFSWNA